MPGRALLAAAAAAAAVATAEASATMYTVSDPSGVCLDGSPGVFFVKRGDESKRNFQIYLKGGGWCVSDDDCVARSLTDLGSSTLATPNFNKDYQSMQEAENPMMWDYHKVELAYCDGASHASELEEPVVTADGTELHFRGAAIFRSMVADLLAEHGLDTANDIVFMGSSAGSLGALAHADEFEQLVADTGAKTRVLLDASFFMDYPEGVSYSDNWKWVFDQHNVSANVNAKCQAAQAEGDEWRCLLAEYALPYVQADPFLLQSRYDSWQAENVVGDPDDVDAMNAFGDALQTRLEAVASSYFLDACYHHTSNQYWDLIRLDNATAADGFGEWFASEGPAPMTWEDEHAYKCGACCKA